MPLLEHEVLGAPAGAPVDRASRVLTRAGQVLLHGHLRSHVVPRREHGPGAGEDHHANLVVGFRLQEGLVELDEQPPVLGVARLGPVELDPDDRALVDRLVVDEPEVGHDALLSPVGVPAP